MYVCACVRVFLDDGDDVFRGRAYPKYPRQFKDCSVRILQDTM